MTEEYFDPLDSEQWKRRYDKVKASFMESDDLGQLERDLIGLGFQGAAIDLEMNLQMVLREKNKKDVNP